MPKGQSDADRIKGRLLRESDFSWGKISDIRLIDANGQPVGPSTDSKSKKSYPVYGETTIDFDDNVSARVPCTVEEAQEYYIGQRARVELITEDDE